MTGWAGLYRDRHHGNGRAADQPAAWTAREQSPLVVLVSGCEHDSCCINEFNSVSERLRDLPTLKRGPLYVNIVAVKQRDKRFVGGLCELVLTGFDTRLSSVSLGNVGDNECCSRLAVWPNGPGDAIGVIRTS